MARTAAAPALSGDPGVRLRTRRVGNRPGRTRAESPQGSRFESGKPAPVLTPIRSGETVKTHDPASGAMEKDYDVTDIERLMGKRDWKSPDDVIKWLQKEGDADRRFTPGEVRHMIEDFSRLRDTGKPLPQDPEQLYMSLKAKR
jgi:hypothetical protein